MCQITCWCHPHIRFPPLIQGQVTKTACQARKHRCSSRQQHFTATLGDEIYNLSSMFWVHPWCSFWLYVPGKPVYPVCKGRSPATPWRKLISAVVSKITFFRSLPKAHDHRGELEHRSPDKSKAYTFQFISVFTTTSVMSAFLLISH